MGIPKTRRGEKTKERLLRAAEKVFGKSGYFDASIGDITRSAKVSTGTFYIYYDSKLEIFRDLIRNLNHKMRAHIESAVAQLSGRKEVEDAGFRSFFEFLRHHRKLYRIVKQAEFIDPKLFQWYYKKIAEGYALGLEEAMNGGEFARADPELLSFALMGIADFTGMRYVLWEDSMEEQKIKDIMKLIFNGILVSDKPALIKKG